MKYRHVFGAAQQLVLELDWSQGTNLVREHSTGSSTDRDPHGPGTSFHYCASISCDIRRQCCLTLDAFAITTTYHLHCQHN